MKMDEIKDVELPEEIKKMNGSSAKRLKKCAKDLEESIDEKERDESESEGESEAS